MLIQYRRALHRIPELDRELPKTTQYLQNILKELDCRVFSPCQGALCAYFDLGKAETVAFRADMDALPMQETTGADYASLHEGRMHACGHDAHMAILLALAHKLDGAKRNVLLIFQPAEETTGGAKAICDSGVLKEYGVRRIYALHLWPGLEKHAIAASERGMMARSSEVTVEFFGKSAHIARAEEGVDALLEAAGFLLQTQGLEYPCVLGFGRLHGGTARNAVCDYARLEGTLRCHDDAVFETVVKQLRTLLPQTAKLHISTGYPPMENDAQLLREARTLLPLHEAEPSYLTDDFSEYLRCVPGVYFRLGIGEGTLHTPSFDFDEAVLQTGLDLLRSLLTEEKL